MKPKSQRILIERILLLLVTAGIGSMMLFSCERQPETADTRGSDKTITAMQQTIAARDSVMDELLTAFNDIDANLETIREKEESLRKWADNEEIPGKREDRIIRDIKVINTLMADNRDEIAALRSKLRKSGLNITALETRLNHMEMAALEKDAELTELKEHLANAETSLANLNDTLNVRELRVALQEDVINTQSAVIKQQDCMMHEAYVATGSYKELKERGLVDRKGGLLGVIGGEKEFTAKTDPDEFTAIDLRDQVKIPVSSKKVELITPHPDGSYALEKDSNGKVSAIDILDPETFWKSSRYLIVATE